MTRIGFVGLGAMGAPMAARLARNGHELAVFDLSAERVRQLEGLGLDPRFVFETIRHGAANSFMLEDRGERMLDREFVSPKSALDIFVKDMGLVLGAAEEKDFSAPLASAARELYETGAAMGLGAEDDSGVIRVFERRADQAGS